MPGDHAQAALETPPATGAAGAEAVFSVSDRPSRTLAPEGETVAGARKARIRWDPGLATGGLKGVGAVLGTPAALPTRESGRKRGEHQTGAGRPPPATGGFRPSPSDRGEVRGGEDAGEADACPREAAGFPEQDGGCLNDGDLHHARGDRPMGRGVGEGDKTAAIGGNGGRGCKPSCMGAAPQGLPVPVPAPDTPSAKKGFKPDKGSAEAPHPEESEAVPTPPTSRRARPTIGWDSSRVSNLRASSVSPTLGGGGAGDGDSVQPGVVRLPSMPPPQSGFKMTAGEGQAEGPSVGGSMRRGLGQHRVGREGRAGHGSRHEGGGDDEKGCRDEDEGQGAWCRIVDTDTSAAEAAEATEEAKLSGLPSSLASTPAACDAAAAALERGPMPAGVGWNPSRVGDKRVPAPIRNEFVCAEARKARGRRRRKATPGQGSGERCGAKRGGRGTRATKGKARAGAVGAREEEGGRRGAAKARVVEGRGTARRELPLRIRALLSYAAKERGIDLRRWFDVRGEGAGIERNGPDEDLERAGRGRSGREGTRQAGYGE